MSDRNPGLAAEPLFVAATRPPMRWGVTYAALLLNIVFTMEAFLITKNLLVLLMALPVHGICALLCLREPRIFDLLLQWGRTRLLAHVCNFRLWQASTASPLTLDLPDGSGHRREEAEPHVAHATSVCRP